MNQNFQSALKFVLRWEGGYVNHPNDKGGATNKGITQATYNIYRKGNRKPTQDVKYITDSEVSEIYYKGYYEASGADKWDYKLSLVVFDTAVNMGVNRAKTFYMQSKGDIKKYLALRENKYKEFARVKGQEVFLKGWLNRLKALQKEIA